MSCMDGKVSPVHHADILGHTRRVSYLCCLKVLNFGIRCGFPQVLQGGYLQGDTQLLSLGGRWGRGWEAGTYSFVTGHVDCRCVCTNARRCNSKQCPLVSRCEG